MISANYLEKCYAGWLGKVIGVRHGAPIEGWTYAKIARTLGEINSYPVDYNEFAADDDTNGPMFFLRALEDESLDDLRDITAEQIGNAWLNYAPYEHGMYWWGGYGRSTEHTAYLNLRAGIPAPRSGSVEQNGPTIAEQIGGQIFIDCWGLICPGRPDLAAEFAQKAASVSHGGNGIYGGMFIAAAIAAAFTARTIDEILDTALAQIPSDCEYARVVGDIRAFHKGDAAKDWHACMRHIIANWGYDRYPGNCHIIPNTAVMIMSLLYGNGEFDRTINICNMGGWDTDCNVGNVGTIIGTLVGLEGIDYDKWIVPIHDFLAASSVVGSMNILDLPDNVRTFARIAYRITKEPVPEHVQSFLNGAKFSFELPDSLHAFHAEAPDKRNAQIYLRNTADAAASGGRSLRAVFQRADAGSALRLYHRTYYRPEHFHDNRYDPCFSPILYPGQTISAKVMAPQGAPRVRVCVYALDGNTGIYHKSEAVDLVPGDWTALSFAIPRLEGACIEQAGIELLPLEGGDVTVFLDDVDFSGGANYLLDFAKERTEGYTGLHREPSQTSYLKGLWQLEEGLLSGSCADFGECYTGNVRWMDVETTCAMTPITNELCGFLFRVQGAMRSYSAALNDGKLLLQKNVKGYYATLAECDFAYEVGKEVTLTAKAAGNRLEISCGGKTLLEAIDADSPYLTGAVGFRVEGGGHAHYRDMDIRTTSLA